MDAPAHPDCKIYTVPPSTSTNTPSSTAVGVPQATCVKALVVQCPAQADACVYTVSASSTQVWSDSLSSSSTHDSFCFSASNKSILTLTCNNAIGAPSTTAAPTTTPLAAVPEESSPVGAIVGGVAGGLVALGLLFFFFRRRRTASRPAEDYACAMPAYSPPPRASCPARSSSPAQAPSSALDYTKVRHLRKYLSTHPTLDSIWMDVAATKTTALKGAESTHMTATVGTQKCVLKGMPYLDVTPATRQSFVEGLVTIHGKALRHRHLTTLQGMTLVESNGHTLLCAVTEFMDHGSIAALLLDGKADLDLHQRTTIAIGIAEAIEYLHIEHGLAFGLVSPDKVLVDGSLHTVKLNVLTLLVPFYEGIRTANLLNNVGSTLHIPFAAPELRRRGSPPTPASDVYAMAVMIGFIFTRKLPFGAVYHDKGLVRGDLYLLQNPTTMPYAIDIIPETLRSTWTSAVDVDPTRRPTASQLLHALNQLPH